MTITDIYIKLFGRTHIKDGDVVSMSEHGRVGGLSTGQPFKYVSLIDGTMPIEGNNSSLVLGYTDGNLTSIQKTIGSTTYQKTLSYTDGNLTGVSDWSEV